MSSRNLLRAGIVIGIAVVFVLWHFPLLTPAGRIRGFNSDAAIIGLMGKRMFDGRGFDIFFWGQNYVGSLTSMLTAAWGLVSGGANPLALRLAACTEALVGTLLVWWGVSRVDVRAATVAALGMALAPPVLLRMMITPLGAEMGFFMSAALFAVLMQHFTAERGRGWLSSRIGQLLFGVLAGVSWWMNQQVVFTLMAGIAVLGFHSELGRALWRGLRLRERLLLRSHMPGIVEALAWIATSAGVLLLVAYVVLDLIGASPLPFVLGHVTDGVVLIAFAQILAVVFSAEWKRWRFRPTVDEVPELMAIGRFLAGAVAGYAPVWLGRILHWYEPSYVFGFAPIFPAELPAQIRTLVEVVPHWAGISLDPAGALYGAALVLFIAAALLRARTDARAFIALIPASNFAFYLLARGAKPHYLIATVGMLLSLAALGALELWDRRSTAIRSLVVAGGVAAFLSIASASQAMQRDVLAEPDPMPLLQRVRDQRCAVVYADFWIAYRYRFLDGERAAWIPYLSQNRTKAESYRFQKLPGQRCLVHRDGSVERIAKDLPLSHKLRIEN